MGQIPFITGAIFAVAGFRFLNKKSKKPIHATQRWGANLESLSQFGLEAETRLHEVGFASNRASAMAR
jgi:hypothetical protein